MVKCGPFKGCLFRRLSNHKKNDRVLTNDGYGYDKLVIWILNSSPKRTLFIFLHRHCCDENGQLRCMHIRGVLHVHALGYIGYIDDTGLKGRRQNMKSMFLLWATFSYTWG